MSVNIRREGFTLIELMVTLAIFSIIVSAVAPSLNSFFQRNKVAAIVNEHSAAIQLARHTAISQNVFVVVCPTTDQSNCSSDWNLTKMVFVDENGDGQLNGQEEIIGSANMVKDFFLKSTRGSLRFAPFNSAQNLTATINICPQQGETKFSRAIVVSNVGRVRIESDPANIDCSD